MYEICLVDELGNIKGTSTYDDAHDPHKPLMHLSFAIIGLTPDKRIVVKKGKFDDKYPLVYDFLHHEHIKCTEKLDEKIKDYDVIAIMDYPYFMKYHNEVEYELCKVVLVRDHSKETSVLLNTEDVKNREEFTPRLYGFIRYYLPRILESIQ